MNPPPAPRPRQRRYSVRRQARLDEETSVKLEALAKTFHRKRAQILRYVMQWGLPYTHGWTIEQSIPDRPHLVHMLVEPELLQQVQDATDSHGVSMAAWVRQAMSEVTLEDFPGSWRVGEATVRSHESGYYHRKFGLRLDEVTSQTLEVLCQLFRRSGAEVIRQLIAQATSEDFPPSWQLAVQKCQASHARHDGLGTREETTS